jgi:putative ABC transport system permease protein
MIKFLLKGLLRDRSRSLFPLLTVLIGVMLTVFAYSYMQGVTSEFIRSTAHFSTGHVRVMSRAYTEEADQIPNDLALIGIDSIFTKLNTAFPELYWTPRIKFGGLLDIPDEQGETRAQGPVMGTAVNLLDPDSPERHILHIREALIRGRLPEKPGEILIGETFARKLKVEPGQTATLISATMYGSMSLTNFTIAGTIHFGIGAMDRSAMIAHLSDIQQALDMHNAAGEIMGFFKDDIYHNQKADEMTAAFNAAYADTKDIFMPEMSTLHSQSGLVEFLDMIGKFSSIFLTIFIVAMSIVLWNAGLMGSLRRYGEIGVRLALGEEKGHIYRSMLGESLMIGLIGSIMGTLAGLGFAYYLQIVGIDIGSIMKSASMMISDVIRARVTPGSFVIGFIPGILATLLGTAISGIGIFKRQTSQLFKELEV